MAQAKRVAFFSIQNWTLGSRAYEEKVVEFEWFSGMSWQQRQKSSLSMLHELSTLGYTPIEISRRAVDQDFGAQLSAFHLKLNKINVENIFQAYKKFNDGGPYFDLLYVDPKLARNDCRLQTYESKKPCQTYQVEYKNKGFYDDDAVCTFCRTRKSRRLTNFTSGKEEWDTEPKSMFYDAIYIAALLQNKQLSDRLLNYNAFTDIEFNQQIAYSQLKGPFNCQARSCAIFVTLKNANYSDEQIAELIHSPSELKKIYGKDYTTTEQQSLF